MAYKGLRLAATCAVILACLVLMVGAFTRLTDAGLGCPDWPGCYGHWVLPTGSSDLTQAQNQYPEAPIESGKAWTEMAHRYAAGTLGLLIFGIALSVFRLAGQGRRVPWVLPSVLLLLVLFQAALGMWTVTLKLLPVVVMGHLLGGLLIFACLCYFWWQLSPFKGIRMPRQRAWINVGILIVFCQIALGGWVSSNYAGIACIGFPRCNGQWLPTLYLSKAFDVFSSMGANYQGGLLDNEIRVTIQWVHRLGACITAVYVLMLSGFLLWRAKSCPLRWVAGFAMFLVTLQFIFGIINVIYLLPLWAAVAHNGLAALLLASMVSLRYLTSEGVSYGG